ncbi:MAG: methyltransferase family protein [Gemmatimonadaceae bacterium]
MLVRHLLSIALLPFVVVVLVPRWLLARDAVDVTIASAALLASGRIVGALAFAAGFTVFVWCVLLFARVGRGTLAPWDPTHRLVVVGPYRHVRNPMITAVCTMLAGEALFFHSARIGGWLLLVVAVNHIYFLVLEEPGLAARFGEEYERYRMAVPRWLPRRRGWP